MNSLIKSTEIIKNSQIPKKYLCNVVFLDKYKIKQTKVIMLEDIFNSSKEIPQMKRIVDKYIQFIIFLWKYKIHENTYKIYSNFGLLDSEIVLVDLFEITNNKKKVILQIENKKWINIRKYRGKTNKIIINYFIEQANKFWTIDKLNKVWGDSMK